MNTCFFFKFIYLESERENRGRAQRKKEREIENPKQVPHCRREQDVGLNRTVVRSSPELKARVGHLADRPTQAWDVDVFSLLPSVEFLKRGPEVIVNLCNWNVVRSHTRRYFCRATLQKLHVGVHLRGAWGAQSDERLTLDLGSGRDLTVSGIKPRVRLCADSMGPAWDSLSLSLPLPYLHTHTLSK